MTKGKTITGQPNINSIEIRLHCGIFFSGNVNTVLIKQRLHRKCCNICKKYPCVYNKKNLTEYYSSQSVKIDPLFCDLEKKNKEYKDNNLVKVDLANNVTTGSK